MIHLSLTRMLRGRSIVWGLTEAALRFIYGNIDDQSATLETGCGMSTVVFALKGSRHTVIAPAPGEFEITKVTVATVAYRQTKSTSFQSHRRRCCLSSNQIIRPGADRRRTRISHTICRLVLHRWKAEEGWFPDRRRRWALVVPNSARFSDRAASLGIRRRVRGAYRRFQER